MKIIQKVSKMTTLTDFIDNNTWKICVSLDPCAGTPNTNQCTGSSILRWTYNSVTDTCKKFNYYDCTPSPNTFSSKKACRSSCKVCKTLDCEDNCYASTKKNGCTKCICPCKVYSFHLDIIFLTSFQVLVAHAEKRCPNGVSWL